MAQALRIENPDEVIHISSRTINSKLWFLNSPPLIAAFLGYLAKYQDVYGVVIYNFVILGNHFHLLASFPNGNMAPFMRDLKAVVAKLTKLHQPEFEGGPLWARRYSSEVVPLEQDIKTVFLYTALNPVSHGLVEKPEQYPLYNGYKDAATSTVRTYSIINWRLYHDKVRFNPDLTPEDFREYYDLVYSKLPGMERMTDKQYKSAILGMVERRRVEIVRKRRAEGKGFLGLQGLAAAQTGSSPKATKTSSRHSKRPLFICSCRETLQRWTDTYFEIRDRYHECVQRMREGVKDIVFPTGTYPPLLLITAQ